MTIDSMCKIDAMAEDSSCSRCTFHSGSIKGPYAVYILPLVKGPCQPPPPKGKRRHITCVDCCSCSPPQLLRSMFFLCFRIHSVTDSRIPSRTIIEASLMLQYNKHLCVFSCKFMKKKRIIGCFQRIIGALCKNSGMVIF